MAAVTTVEVDLHSDCPSFGPNTEGRCWACGTPLRGRRRFCDRDCGRAWSDAHVWSAARIVALTRAGYRCERCGRDALRLDVHHVVPLPDAAFYDRPGCWHHPDGLLVVCADGVGCHKREHDWLRFADGVRGQQLRLLDVA